MNPEAERWLEKLRPVFAGRKWILATDALAAVGGRVALLHALGAESIFVVAGSRGVGDVVGPDLAEVALLGVRGEGMLDGIRKSLAAFEQVPDDVRARIDAWDPAGEARVLGPIFATGTQVAGRPYFGGRPREWWELEDKTRCDEIFAQAGVALAPHVLAAAQGAALREAAARVDLGQGTVWAGDSKAGFNGGGASLRWIRPGADDEAAVRFFEGDCDTVRVMPFLEGVPCSIHGIVLPDRVLALRPCEMLILRGPDPERFTYVGTASFWEPPEADCLAMRQIARDVGEVLRNTVDFRGCFTVDGVMTTDGFRPTEVNPRMGGAVAMLTGQVRGLPFDLMNYALAAGADVDWEGDALERLILEASAVQRVARGPVMLSGERTPATLFLRWTGATWTPTEEASAAHATLRLGPATTGSMVLFRIHPGGHAIGPSAAPRVRGLLQWVAQHWGLEIPQRETARDVRPRSQP